VANFTDTNLPQYKPYVSEMSPEIFHEVGQQKQQQYNQGVQLIQSQINNVAGLDVLRGIDKDYLHSKLNELGSNLSTFAASDFSDNQLVNSVSGMANSVAKDQRIQNAVYSTQKVRNEVQNMQQAQKDGKSHIANEWWFNNQLNDYTNSQDPNATFNGKYVPYTDLNKKFTDVLDSLVKENVGKESTTENPYKTNSDGSPLTDKNGNKVYTYADAMTKVIKSGIPKEKIEAALRASLDDNDMQQLQISSAYQFKDYNKQDLFNTATKQYNKELLSTQERIKNLALTATMFKANTEQYNQFMTLAKQLKEYIKPGGELEQNFNSNIEQANQNPDAVKFNIYKDDFIKQFAASRDSYRESLEYVDNPGLKQQNWRADYALNAQKAQEEASYHSKQLGIEGQKLNIEQQKLELEKEKQRVKNLGQEGDVTTYGLSTAFNKPVDERIADARVEATQTYDNNLASLTDKVNKEISSLTGSNTIILPDGIVFTKDSKATKQQVENAINAWSDDPRHTKGSFNPSDLGRVKEILDAKSKASGLKNLIDATEKEVKADPEILEKAKTLGIDLNTFKSGAQSNQNQYLTGFGTPVSHKRTPQDVEVGISGPADELRKLIQNKIREKLAEKAPQFVPRTVDVAIPGGEEGKVAREHYITMATNTMTRNSIDKGGQDASYKDLPSWFSDDKVKDKLQFKMYSDGSKNQMWVINPADPTNVQRIDLTPEQIGRTVLAQPGPTEEIKNKFFMSSTGYTTNTGIDNPNDPSTAHYKMTDLAGIKTYKVAADITRDADSYERGGGIIHFQTKDGWKNIDVRMTPSMGNIGGSMSFTDIKRYIEDLDDERFLGLVKQYAPSLVKDLVK